MKLRTGLTVSLCVSSCLAMSVAWTATLEDDQGASNESQMTEFEKEALYRTYEYDKLLLGSDWFNSRGYAFETNASYAAYSEPELLSLARSGDSVAQVVAVESLLFKSSEGEPFQELMRFHESAVINGYSSTFMTVVATYIFRARYFDDVVAPVLPAQSESDVPLINSLAEESARGNAMKTLIWQLVAQMRGDPRGGLNGPDLKAYGLSMADGAKACNLANELYAKLNDARQRRGFREFTVDLPAMSPTDISDFGALCESWPVPRLTCMQQKVDAELVPLSGYRCTPIEDGKQNASL